MLTGSQPFSQPRGRDHFSWICQKRNRCLEDESPAQATQVRCGRVGIWGHICQGPKPVLEAMPFPAFQILCKHHRDPTRMPLSCKIRTQGVLQSIWTALHLFPNTANLSEKHTQPESPRAKTTADGTPSASSPSWRRGSSQLVTGHDSQHLGFGELATGRRSQLGLALETPLAPAVLVLLWQSSPTTWPLLRSLGPAEESLYFVLNKDADGPWKRRPGGPCSWLGGADRLVCPYVNTERHGSSALPPWALP